MTISALLFAWLQAAGAGGIWPVTVAGWVALFASVVALLGAIYSYAKFVVQLNGLGARMNKIETAQETDRAVNDELHEAVKATLAAGAGILERVGEAKQRAETCDDRTQQMGIDLGSKIDELRQTTETGERRLSDQMLALVTELRTRNIIGARAGFPREEDSR